MARYGPLKAHLRRRGSAELELAFEEVERIIKSKLPASVSRPQWWANERDPGKNHVQCRSWPDVGDEAFLLPQERVLFRERADIRTRH
jgi:hypothetical protein